MTSDFFYQAYLNKTRKFLVMHLYVSVLSLSSCALNMFYGGTLHGTAESIC